jgi:undecaprenyl-diphosphatase
MAKQIRGHKIIRRQPQPKEIILGIIIILIGVALEYIDTVVLGSTGPSGPDVFPPSIAQGDASLLLLVNPGLLNPFLNIFFSSVTHLGSTLAIVIFCVLLYWVGYRREAALIFATVVIGTLIVAPLKLVVLRPRPYSTLPSVVPLDTESGSSFPSGHSERVFALAAVFPTKKSLRVSLLYLLAIIVAFSRVYVGVHYPLDVATGILIGFIVGKVTLRFQDRLLTLAKRLGSLFRLQ